MKESSDTQLSDCSLTAATSKSKKSNLVETELQFQDLVAKYFAESANSDMKATINHFRSKNKHSFTIWCIIKRFLAHRASKERRVPDARKKIMTPRTLQQIEKYLDNHDNISGSQISQELGCS